MVPQPANRSRGLASYFFARAQEYARRGKEYVTVSTVEAAGVLAHQYPHLVYVPSATVQLLDNLSGMPIRYGNPLKNVIQQAVQVYREHGFMDHWRKRALEASRTVKTPTLNVNMTELAQGWRAKLTFEPAQPGQFRSTSIMCGIIGLAAMGQLATELLVPVIAWRLRK